ncbi:MAG: hypothetical protein AUJ49_07485 [Desulfovibrionaceae bacterium CG1_02_65_16]|nr:MAG: hypothetical protein AUJ49_07485 [Desulfovibrionaceae bacterium CG1_02_65_16]
MEENKLFAVLLGGNPPGTGVEVHDVVFTVGPTLEATRWQMLAAWFAGGPAPHIDSWMELDVVDGARIALTTDVLTTDPAPGGRDLWHVYLGYYEPGDAGFVEGHESLFVVAADAAEAKARAKRLARRAPAERLHTDALRRVSDRLAGLGLPYRVAISETGAPDETGQRAKPAAHDGYQPFPEEFLSAHWRKA